MYNRKQHSVPCKYKLETTQVKWSFIGNDLPYGTKTREMQILIL